MLAYGVHHHERMVWMRDPEIIIKGSRYSGGGCDTGAEYAWNYNE